MSKVIKFLMGGKEAGKLLWAWSLGPWWGVPSLSDPTANTAFLFPGQSFRAPSPAWQLAGPPVVLWHPHLGPCSRGQLNSPGPGVLCFSSEGAGHSCSQPVGQTRALPNRGTARATPCVGTAVASASCHAGCSVGHQAASQEAQKSPCWDVRPRTSRRTPHRVRAGGPRVCSGARTSRPGWCGSGVSPGL